MNNRDKWRYKDLRGSTLSARMNEQEFNYVFMALIVTLTNLGIVDQYFNGELRFDRMMH